MHLAFVHAIWSFKMIDEIEVATPRHKKKLEEIRQNGRGNTSDSSENFSRGYSEASSERIQRAQGTDEGSARGIAAREEGMDSSQGADGRSNQGIRSSNTATFTAIEGSYPSDRSAGTGQLISELTEEQEAERQRELARQRKQRQRDREKAEKSQDADAYLSSYSDRDRYMRDAEDVTHGVTDGMNTSRFTLKNPLKNPLKILTEQPEKVKLFTNKEAEEEQERLSFIYSKGSGLLDDILEIVVAGHQEVQIWQLDDGESNMLATMHLEKAKKEQSAARSARTLLSIYDRLFTIMLLGPRCVRTRQYVKEQGGFSFK
jgi:hypothetical protein